MAPPKKYSWKREEKGERKREEESKRKGVREERVRKR